MSTPFDTSPGKGPDAPDMGDMSRPPYALYIDGDGPEWLTFDGAVYWARERGVTVDLDAARKSAAGTSDICDASGAVRGRVEYHGARAL